MMLCSVPFPLGLDGYACALAVFAAGLVAILTVAPARSFAWWSGAVDQPGGRRSHAVPTARLGGLAVLAAVVVGCATPFAQDVVAAGAFEDRFVALPWILGVGALVCALGAVDDVRGISPLQKMLGLTAAAIVVSYWGGVSIEVIELPGLGKFELGMWAVPLTVIWIVACTNAVNLIDGVDGGGASVGMVSSAILALVALGSGDIASSIVFCALAGATAGFLFHNRHPATIFLGDSGSLLIGFMISATSAAGCTKRTTALSLIAALCALAVPLLDSTQSFCRRFRRSMSADGRRRLLSAVRATAIADQEHIHHRLLSRGLNHAQVARVLGLVTALTGLVALLLLPNGTTGTLTVVGAGLAAGVVLLRLGAVRQNVVAAVDTATPGVTPDVVPDVVIVPAMPVAEIDKAVIVPVAPPLPAAQPVYTAQPVPSPSTEVEA